MMSLRVIYTDRDLCICVKPAGIPSEGEGMPSLLKTALNCDQVYPVHRLDQAAGGLMVFALTKKAAAEMTSLFSGNQTIKEYLAVVSGIPENREGIFSDWLFHDQRKNKTFVVDKERKGVKKAELAWILQGVSNSGPDPFSLVRVALHTGRTHQIRVQFSSRKMPLVGDGKYGSRIKAPFLALWCCRLAFRHPLTGEMIDFYLEPPTGQFPFDHFEL